MSPSKARLKTWLADPLAKEVRWAVDRLLKEDDVVQVALMPDVHLAHDICVGTVVATQKSIYPQAVGGDIGCGMASVAFDFGAELLNHGANAAQILSAFGDVVPILKHRRPKAPYLEVGGLSCPSLQNEAQREGARQLGTLGRGNHFLELQADEDGVLWLCVHSGSRAIGRKIMASHLLDGEGRLIALDAESEDGLAYLQDQDWALNYAQRNRTHILEAACAALTDLFGIEPDWQTLIECHHNMVRLEQVGEAKLWVHRKGAISARQGEAGIIPGSMGSATYHVSGRGCEQALHSSSHGAGRVCSRTEVRGRVSSKDLFREMEGVWFDRRKRETLREEAPSAYREITKVMRAQKKLTRILKPLLSFKG